MCSSTLTTWYLIINTRFWKDRDKKLVELHLHDICVHAKALFKLLTGDLCACGMFIKYHWRYQDLLKIYISWHVGS